MRKVYKYWMKRVVIIIVVSLFILQFILFSPGYEESEEHIEEICRQLHSEHTVDLDDKVSLEIVRSSILELRFINRPYMNCRRQDSEDLAKFVRARYFVDPSTEPYNLSEPEYQSPQNWDILEMVYQEKTKVPRHGFFIEAGSSDGFESVSLDFELLYGWKGLLVEANPWFFDMGLAKHRKSYCVNTCLGIQKRPHYSNFDFFSAVVGRRVQCIPLYTLILAAGNPTVNVLILDVEGAELHVLKTIPWDKVDIEIMTIETDLVGKSLPGSSQAGLREYVESQGYVRFKHRAEVNFRTGLFQNDLFVRKDIVDKYNVKQI